MNSTIFISVIGVIITVAGIVVSIIFGLVPRIRKEKITGLNEMNKILLRDIKQLHEIEEELLNELENYGCNKNATKRKIREKVRANNGGRKLSRYSEPAEYNARINR